LPITAVVSPSAGEGDTHGSQRDLRVVVRVVVDDARHEREAVGIDAFLRTAIGAAQAGDAAVLHRQVARTGASRGHPPGARYGSGGHARDTEYTFPMEQFRLEGQVAIVTGGANGIGAATVALSKKPAAPR